jgi:hypothetical protein
MSSRPSSARPAARKGLWFPLSLALLVLLALPGAILLALSLLGMESTANAWLRKQFALSYHNPLPMWSAILLFLIPVILTLLYFLKLRRKALEVPSTFLWRKSIEDLHVNSFFQWLRDNILLLVQLSIVLLLIYSALAFQFHGRSTTAGKHYILLLDSSASMACTDVSPSRLEVARGEALKLIDARPEGDTGMVIEFNSRATILQPYTRDKGLLRAAVRRISQTQRPTRIDEALALADSLANPHRSADDEAVRPTGENAAEARSYVSPDGISAEVHLFSDGRFPDVPAFAAGNLSLNYHRTGAAVPDMVNNIGIVSFSAVRDDKDSARLQVFVRMLNFRKESARVTVELEWGPPGGANLNLREAEVRLPARLLEISDPKKNQPARDTPGEGAVTFDLDDVDEASDVLLHVRLKNHRDQFALDNEAWLIAGVIRKARVLIVTPGNDILRNFFDLDETAKVASVTYLSPAELVENAKYLQPARAGAFDLVIFDRCAPPNHEALPLANTFFIADVPPPWKRAVMPALKNAVIRNPASSHLLMRHLSGLDEIAFSEAFRFDLREPRVPPQVPRLLEADRETALLFVLPRRAFRDLVLTFPLVNDKGQWTTNWNLKLSFPVFLRNLLYQLGNVSDAAAEETVQPGEVKVLRPEGTPERIEVVDPGRVTNTVKRQSGGEFPYQNTERVGVYQATWSGGGRAFAVNLLDAEESNTQPRDEIKIGEQNIEADLERLHSYDTWKWVALVAFLLLFIEWAVFHRRWWFGR